MEAKEKIRSRGMSMNVIPSGLKVAKTMIEAGTTGENELANDFTVDWDGPDDPSDPKKSSLPTDYDLRLKSPPAAGRSAKNGS